MAVTNIVIPIIETKVMSIVLVGDSPLICHRFSEKAQKQMLDKQNKSAMQARPLRDREAEYMESLYHISDGVYGFPASGFKGAAVSACRFLDLKMTEARGAFHIPGDLLEIFGDPPRMREDIVRLSMNKPDFRYRGEFPKWFAEVPVRFNAGALSESQIVNLFNVAGFGVGIGEWRPEKDGSYGMFHVATGEEHIALAEAIIAIRAARA